MTTRSVIVVGGCLSSMVVARELALRGWRVILLECSRRLGGKAGSDMKNGRMVEHGYHVFPQWYPNVRATGVSRPASRTCVSSRKPYGLSFIDVGHHWNGLDGKPQLSFISSNYGPLNAVSKEGAKDLLLREICEYLPITHDDVENWELYQNSDVPLFINTIVAWSTGPGQRQR